MESWSAVMFTVSVRLLAPVLRLVFVHSIKGYPSHPPFTSHPRMGESARIRTESPGTRL